MPRLRLRKPSPAMAVAVVALFIALGGTSYAAFGPFTGNSIIVKYSISGNRLKNHTVTGQQVKATTFPKVPRAAAADTAGSANTANSAGTAGALGGVVIVAGKNTAAPAGEETGQNVDCPSGMVAIAGGVRTAGGGMYIENVRIASNDLGARNTEVRGAVLNTSGHSDQSHTFHVQAVCIHGQVSGGES